jgi:hypothetical protein
MGDRISVRLTGPAKIEGKWRKAGEEVAVSPDLALELAAAGVVDRDGQSAAEVAPGMPGYDEAVAAMAKTLAADAVQTAVDEALAEVIADRDAYRAQANDAAATVSRQSTRILELEAEAATADEKIAALEAEVAALQPQNTEGGNTTTPKRPPKKGLGAADQG